jgi:hypothetical protein
MAGDFSIGRNKLPGLGKVIEETAELNVVLGKLIATNGNFDYWGRNLRQDLLDEIADVAAALKFFTILNTTVYEANNIQDRINDKIAQYQEWYEDDIG